MGSPAAGATALLVFALALPGVAAADPGELDRTWAGDGTAHTAGLGDFVDSASVAVQPDGKVVAVGSAATSTGGGFRSLHQIVVLRYHPNGVPDTTFSGDGIVKTDVPDSIGDDVGVDVAIAADGKIVVGATAYDASQPDPIRSAFAVLRYHPSGTLDTSFGGDGIVHTWGPPPCTQLGCPVRPIDSLRSVHVQPDSKVIAVGDMVGDVTVVRYTSSGTPDTSFDADGFAVFPAVCCASGPGMLHPDGKILVSGDWGILRVSSNGAPDPGFGAGGLVDNPDGSLSAFAVAADGSVAAATHNSGCFPAPCSVRVRRWTSAGQPDAGWGSGGAVTLTDPTSLAVSRLAFGAGGRLLVEGARSTAPQRFLRRLTASGAPDGTLAPGGEVGLPAFSLGPRSSPAAGVGPNRPVLQPDGKLLVVGGNVTAAGMQVARFLLDATPARLAGPIACNATSIGSGAPTVYGGDPANWQYVAWRSDFYRYVPASGSWELAHSTPFLVSAATKTTPATQWYDLGTGQPAQPLQTHTTMPPGGAWAVAHLVLWYTQQGQLVSYAYDLAGWVSGANAFPPLCYSP